MCHLDTGTVQRDTSSEVQLVAMKVLAAVLASLPKEDSTVVMATLRYGDRVIGQA